MQIIGCDLLDTETEELVNRTLLHEAGEVREFYSQLPRPALVGIEAIGPMQWFLSLLEELGIECQVGDAAKIRAAEPRKMRYSDCLGEWIATRSWPVALRRASEDWFLPLPPHASNRRSASQTLYWKMEEEVENLTAQVLNKLSNARERDC
jgi:hypothetical protein